MARPRGWAAWNPNAQSAELIEQVRAVLDEYSEQLPMTARQIFYRLVGAYGYDKTERAYSRLCEKLVRARRAKLISFDDIRDDGTTRLGGDFGYADPESFYDALRSAGERYFRETREGQPERVELWCEAAGMAPQLERIAREYGVPVYSTGGFSSVTVTYELAQRIEDYGEQTAFLHVGDYDPSGESIFDAICTDVEGFLYDGSIFLPERVALTAAQVEQHDLPTAPPKVSDSRSANWHGETTQAEALPPDLLADIVRAALEGHTDMDLAAEVEARADEEREAVEARLAEIDF